jgi:hypothetical protein
MKSGRSVACVTLPYVCVGGNDYWCAGKAGTNPVVNKAIQIILEMRLIFSLLKSADGPAYHAKIAHLNWVVRLMGIFVSTRLTYSAWNAHRYGPQCAANIPQHHRRRLDR